MSWHVNIFLVGSIAQAEPLDDTGSEDAVLYEASRRMEIFRRFLRLSAQRCGSKGDVFEVTEIRYLDSCPAGWGKQIQKPLLACPKRGQRIGCEPKTSSTFRHLSASTQ